MPEYGDMPMGILPLACPSRVWWLPEVILMVVVVLFLLPLDGFTLVSPVISSMSWSGSRSCKGFPGSSSAREATAAVDTGQRRGGVPVADWEGAQPRRISRSGYGADRLPAGSIDPPFLQARGWPTYFLPALMPKGRQPAFCSRSMAWCYGDSAVPSGDVPGDDGAVLRRKQFRAQLQSLSAFQGPICIFQGLVCNFPFLRGPSVRCVVLQCFE